MEVKYEEFCRCWVWFLLYAIAINPIKPAVLYLICTSTSVQLQLVLHVSNLDLFWSSKRQNNCSHISRWTLTGLKQLGFTWFSSNHFLEKSVRLKSDHQDLLRSVCFQKLYFHCSSAEEWSSSHIFWGAFISSSLNQHWIALYVWIISISSY